MYGPDPIYGSISILYRSPRVASFAARGDPPVVDACLASDFVESWTGTLAASDHPIVTYAGVDYTVVGWTEILNGEVDGFGSQLRFFARLVLEPVVPDP